MLVDMWFYPQSTNDLQQLEFDPDLFFSQLAYKGSIACQLIGTDAGHWQLWDSLNNNWVATSHPCTASTIAAGTWHHLQLYITFNTSTQQYFYQTFVYDGTTVFQNLGQPFSPKSEPGWSDNLNIEQQIDTNSNVGASTTVNYDSYNLWVW
jgi:hypothetical protein